MKKMILKQGNHGQTILTRYIELLSCQKSLSIIHFKFAIQFEIN